MVGRSGLEYRKYNRTIDSVSAADSIYVYLRQRIWYCWNGNWSTKIFLFEFIIIPLMHNKRLLLAIFQWGFRGCHITVTQCTSLVILEKINTRHSSIYKILFNCVARGKPFDTIELCIIRHQHGVMKHYLWILHVYCQFHFTYICNKLYCLNELSKK